MWKLSQEKETAKAKTSGGTQQHKQQVTDSVAI